MSESDDPTVVRTVVISATDLVTVLESSHRTAGRDTVLRVTPPFSGRMRARLHVQRGANASSSAPICLQAQSLVEETCPEPPEPDDVEDALRADSDVSYTIDRHQERYRAALQSWRTSVPDHVVETIELASAGNEITISILGTVDGE